MLDVVDVSKRDMLNFCPAALKLIHFSEVYLRNSVEAIDAVLSAPIAMFDKNMIEVYSPISSLIAGTIFGDST